MRLSLYAPSVLFLLCALVSAVPVRSTFLHFVRGSSKHDMCGVQQMAEPATGLDSVSPLRGVSNPRPS